MLIVAAVGGNALLHRGELAYPQLQRRNVAVAAAALAPLAREHSLVITHGNGPQVGLLALENGSEGVSSPYPLDIVGAESQGMIGYLLELALRNELPDRAVATLLGQVLVHPNDPAFARPTKPIGPFYTAAQAEKLRATTTSTPFTGTTRQRRLSLSPPLRFRASLTGGIRHRSPARCTPTASR